MEEDIKNNIGEDINANAEDVEEEELKEEEIIEGSWVEPNYLA